VKMVTFHFSVSGYRSIDVRKKGKPYQLFGHTKHSIPKRGSTDENKNHLFHLHIIRSEVELCVELFLPSNETPFTEI